MDLEQVKAASAARLRAYKERVAQRNEVGVEEQHVLYQDDVRTRPGYGRAALGRQIEDMDEPVMAAEIKQLLPYLTLVPVPSAQSLVEEYMQHTGAAATVKGLCWYVLCTRSNYQALFGALYDTFADNGLYPFDPWETGNACGPMHDLMHELCAVVVRAYGLESLVTTMDNPDDLELDLLLEEFAGTITSGCLVHPGEAAVRVLAHTATQPGAAPYATDEIDAWIADHAEHAAEIGAKLEVEAEQLGRSRTRG